MRSACLGQNSIYVGRESGELDVFDVRSLHNPLENIKCHNGKIMSVACSEGLLATGGADSRVQLFKI